MDEKKPVRKSIRSFFGLPNREALADVFKLIYRYRLVVFIYLLIILVYFIFFSKTFNHDFLISFSASVLEDIVMFIFLTLSLTYISIKQSSINPEDHAFDRRVRAIMNSKNVKNDDRVFEYLKNNISRLLAFNKSLKYEIFITEYFNTEEAYSIVNRRTQTMSNICKDHDFESPDHPITITTDIKIGNSFGQVKFLGVVGSENPDFPIRPIIDEGDNYQLNEGENKIQIDMPVLHDSEIGYKLTYQAYSKVGDKSSLDAWLFLEASKYTKSLEFRIKNNLKGSKKIKFDIRRRDNDGEINYIDEAKTLSTDSSPAIYLLNTSLLPGERIEFYIYKPEAGD